MHDGLEVCANAWSIDTLRPSQGRDHDVALSKTLPDEPDLLKLRAAIVLDLEPNERVCVDVRHRQVSRPFSFSLDLGVPGRSCVVSCHCPGGLSSWPGAGCQKVGGPCCLPSGFNHVSSWSDKGRVSRRTEGAEIGGREAHQMSCKQERGCSITNGAIMM